MDSPSLVAVAGRGTSTLLDGLLLGLLVNWSRGGNSSQSCDCDRLEPLLDDQRMYVDGLRPVAILPHGYSVVGLL